MDSTEYFINASPDQTRLTVQTSRVACTPNGGFKLHFKSCIVRRSLKSESWIIMMLDDVRHIVLDFESALVAGESTDCAFVSQVITELNFFFLAIPLTFHSRYPITHNGKTLRNNYNHYT